jgi:Ca-activated chloride channel homolog
MDLLWPGFLLLLGLIPLLIVVYIWILRRRRRFAVRYSSLSLVHDALPKRSNWRRHIPFALFLVAITSLILALVRPVVIVTVPIAKRTIILAIDVSRSMCSTDVKPSRIGAAKTAADSFIQREGGNSLLGVVAFAGFAVVVQPPTSDLELLQSAIDSLTVGRRTAIGSGVLKSIDAIAEGDKSIPPSLFDPSSGVAPSPLPKNVHVPAIIVLLTDGVSNVGPLPLDAAQQAADRGIRVYTIGFGTADNNSIPNCDLRNSGEPSGFGGSPGGNGFGGGFGNGFGGGGFGGFRRGIDEDTLKKVAELTGGAYYSAESASDLEKVFQDLPIDVITKNETMEISVAFTALGTLLAGLAIVLSLLWNPQN